MVLKYELSSDELSENLLDSIKKVFQKKRITITVAEAEMDETEYLLSTEANSNALAESMAQLERGEVVKFSLEELSQYEHEK